MPISLSCTCGKRFSAKPEFAGKKIRCSGCGNVLVVPGKAAPVSEDKSKPRSDSNHSRSKPVKTKKKPKKRRRRESDVPTFALSALGLSFGKLFGLLIVAGGIGGIVWLLWPSTRVDILESTRVEAFSAARVTFPNIVQVTGDRTKGEGPVSLRIGARHLLVARPGNTGKWLIVTASIPPKVIDDNARIQSGSIIIGQPEMQLKAGGQSHPAVFLRYQYPDRSVDVRLSKDEARVENVKPAQREPWSVDGTIEGLETIQHLPPDDPNEQEQNPGQDPLRQFEPTGEWAGAASFRSANGMEVSYSYQGPAVNISWDAQSRGWVEQTQLDILQSNVMLQRLELTMVFPYDPGPGERQLIFFGKPIATFSVP